MGSILANVFRCVSEPEIFPFELSYGPLLVGTFDNTQLVCQDQLTGRRMNFVKLIVSKETSHENPCFSSMS